MASQHKLVSYTEEERKFYAEGLAKKRAQYTQILENPTVHGKDFWDVVVITAIDDAQKEYYEQNIQMKLARREIPSCVQYHVIPDPKGTKVGNGGSTLVVLDFLEHKYGPKMDQYRVLLIHAGGYSKRLANHSISGKIFCPIPLFLNQASPSITMLELKFIMFMDFPKNMKAGVFLTCADDIELFESEGCDFTRSGVTALAHPSNTEIGLTHGVFVLDKSELKNFNRNSIEPRKCTRYLHKPTMETMQNAGAIIQDDEVFVDSNFYFDRSVEKILLSFFHSGKLDCEVDAYGDFLQPLGEKASDSYFNNTRTTGSVTPAQVEKRKQLFDLLRNTPMHVIPFIPSLFIHLGTCKEYVSHLCDDLPDFGFQNFSFSEIVPSKHRKEVTTSNISPKSCVQYSLLSDSVKVSSNAVIEYCRILNDKEVTIGENTIMSQISLPSTVDHISGGVLMHTLVLRNHLKHTSFVTILFGVDDDVKAGASINGEINIALKGVQLTKIIPQLGLTVEDVWGSQKSPSLWNAKLFIMASSAEDSAGYSVHLLNVADSIREGKPIDPVDWKNLSRISLDEAIGFKDMHGQSYYFRTKHEQDITFLKLEKLFRKEVDVTTWMKDLPLIGGYVGALIGGNSQSKENLDMFLKRCIEELVMDRGLEKGRASFSISTLISEIVKLIPESRDENKFYSDWAQQLYKKAYSNMRDILLHPFLPKLNELPFLQKAVKPNHGALAKTNFPARIILAGGWSDTPPFCLEKGGDIVNFAININGKKPITVHTKIIPERMIRLKSVDAAFEEEFPTDQLYQLFNYNDPKEPLALHKACICFTLFPQFCTEDRSSDFSPLNGIYDRYIGDCGLELFTDVDIPKGSGLGTSSIVMLAVVRALRQLLGISCSGDAEKREEFNAVLAIEQMLTTGGGWQDQVGGGTPGLKFIAALASENPEYTMETLNLSQKHIDYFNNKLLVVYTGKTRMAKPILWNIVDNWQMRRSGTTDALYQIKERAPEMWKLFKDFANRDVDTPETEEDFNKLGQLLDKIKRHNIDLEKSISNEYLESLFAAISGFVSGSQIIGAGSGGFILGWLKKGCTKQQVADYLKAPFPNAELTEMSICTDFIM